MRLACSHPSVPPFGPDGQKDPYGATCVYACVRMGKTLVSGPAVTQQPWFCQVACQLLIGSPGRGGRAGLESQGWAALPTQCSFSGWDSCS